MLDTDGGKDEVWGWSSWPRMFRDVAFGVSVLSALVAALALGGLGPLDKGVLSGIIAIWLLLFAAACEYINRTNDTV